MKNFKSLKIFGWAFVILAFSQIATAQLPQSCSIPGTLVVSDSTNPVTAQLDIQSVSVAEPYFSDGSQKLVFTLKVQNLSPLPASSWNVFFTGPDNVIRFVQMSTLLGNPQYRYGTVSSLAGIPLFNYSGNIQGGFTNDGNITFYMDKNLAGNLSNGQTIAVSARTYIKPLLDLVEVDEAGAANYTIAGNGGCTPFKFLAFGQNGDVPVTNDYTRNKTNDFAVWRPANGFWYTSDSVTGEFNAVPFGSGTLGDVPVPGDYDNDGKGDFAVYRRSAGIFYIFKTETNSYDFVKLGMPEDIPFSGDFDGDRIDDVAVYRPETGTWIIRNSIDSSVTSVPFGVSEDRPVVGDYDGDRKADIAVFRPSSGVWFIRQSSDNSVIGVRYGAGTDVAVPADYDGDEKTDIAVWRPETGVWYVLQSNSGASTGVAWGATSDRVQPGDYNGNGRADYAVWRPENGVWYVFFN